MFPARIRTERLLLDRHDEALEALELYEYAGADQSDTIATET